ncbi:zinc-dependent metalloprotease [Bdellovibrio sp. SKB1291214]|uniref:zinc-dependent metalloprotease n=1 Tax=Bdellovibrio sp. SKB1291214 TaxID=1732569 RepID=UPI000B51C932|nr:zinc-dependent metalloprotease [Bdellovibrio sp. SKB1291214]UYL07976.1 zinc-dependent metalloprotease [Bdellovibrio sp. SKB1291214]
MSFSRNILFFGAVLSILVVTGCTNGFDVNPLIEKKQAPKQIVDSFSIPGTQSAEIAAQCEKATCLTINKSSLGKIFLLISSGKTGGSTPQWYDLKPQVVSFEKSGSRLAMLGQNYNSIYEELQTQSLIQTFRIVGEDTETITFDWGRGLKSLIAQNAYDVDYGTGMNDPLTESSVPAIPVMDSYTRNIKIANNSIELNQISKIQSLQGEVAAKNKIGMETREETLDMNIQIRAYRLESKFKPKEYDASRSVGFFVTRVARASMSKDAIKLIAKWDLSEGREPITVRVSAAVPEDYVQAVKEGALYWNKVFGKEAVVVETGVDPQATPKDHSIMIRWVTWLDAGAAYAISQSDPLTGELLRAQVFLPSVFTKVGSGELVQLNGGSPVATGAIACDFTGKIQELQKITKEASTSQRLRLAQDSVRSTVAHELGHAMGLRHNFAGSFSAKATTKEIYDSAKTYLKDPNHPGIETSTSIMDYVSGIDDVLNSARIKHAALSYDKMAMDWAYSDNDEALDSKISQYCTDEDIGLANSQGMAIYGCERFDNGNNPLLRKYLDGRDEKANLVKVLFASIIGRMYPGDQPEVVNNLDAVINDTYKWGKAAIDLSFVGKALFNTSEIIGNTAAGMPALVSLDAVKSGNVLAARTGQDSAMTDLRLAHLADAAKYLQGMDGVSDKVGGYAAMLNGLLRNAQGQIDMDWFVKEVQALKNSGVMAKGKTLAGREYSLTEEQQAKILKFYSDIQADNAKIIFSAVRELLPIIQGQVKGDDGRVKVINKILPMDIVKQADSDMLGNIALDLMLASKETIDVQVGEAGAIKAQLPIPFLNSKERISLLTLLSSQGLSFPMDMKRAQVRASLAATVNEFLAQIDSSLVIDTMSEADQSALSDKLLKAGLIDATSANWIVAQVRVLQALTSLN